MKSYWMIDGYNDEFRTLEEAKLHIWANNTPRELKREDGNQIMHIVNEEVVSTVDIRVNDKGKLSFGRVEKLPWWATSH